MTAGRRLTNDHVCYLVAEAVKLNPPLTANEKEVEVVASKWPVTAMTVTV